jgi:SRSO17 transposase
MFSARSRLSYVLAVACDRQVTCPAGRFEARQLAQRCQQAKTFPTLSAGSGSKGERIHRWALVAITNPDGVDGGCHHLLIRSSPTTGELAYYLTCTPDPVPLSRLVKVAGRRWRVEESFQTSKGLAGLDEHQVRTWTSWQRWICAVLWSYALLVATTVAVRRAEETPADMVRLSVNEQRHLLHIAEHQPHLADHAWACSNWRRRHQHRAQQYHQKRHDHDLRL